jgi:hypothetical protein
MMFTIKTVVARRLAFVTGALGLMLLLASCTAGASQQSGSLASHGVDYIPVFDTPYSGGGGRG